jgi:hypothetical protein
MRGDVATADIAAVVVFTKEGAYMAVLHGLRSDPMGEEPPGVVYG